MHDAVTLFAADRKSIESRFDGPYSLERRIRLRELYDAWSVWLDSLDWPALSRPDQVDATLLGIFIASERTCLDMEETRFEEMSVAWPAIHDMVGLLDARRKLDDTDPRDAARCLCDASAGLSSLASQAAGGVSPVLANRLAGFLDKLKKSLAEWHAFRAGYDPEFTWWLASPYHRFEENLTKAVEALRRSNVEPTASEEIVGDPVGREGLVQDLSAAMIPYTPEELIRIGEIEMTWCRAEMASAARDMGLADDWRGALERVKDDHVPPGRQAMFVRDLAREAVAFVIEHDLMTIPELALDGWRIEMMPPERQKVNPFFLGGEAIIVSYPTDAMDHELKLMSMRGNNRHFSRATVQHELIPGHFMQHYCGERYRPYRRLFRTPFWTEGWTLYWELRLWDLGFPRTPEERIGMLFWRMHRCARIVFSLRFHMGEMTAGDCVEMLVQEVGHERATAEGEVRRSFGGDYPPLYQCAYMIGGLQMRALHREMVLERGMSERQFHDAVMRENCMPIAMLRAILRDDPIERHALPTWRFYGEISQSGSTVAPL